MRINLPEDVNYIICTLQQHGFEAYAVGGCVRDILLGRIPGDWDITTSAKPKQVKEIFTHTIDTGILHGTVTVMLHKVGYEVTTYRIDGEYEDARHPKEVTFTSNLIEDLKRRDFTINAMAYNDTEGLIDAFTGLEDLEKGVIQCVGNPKERFSEDALRMLRAVRFAAQLGFEIEENTADAIFELSHTIEKISAERIQVELVKLLLSPHPEEIETAYKLGLTKVFLPEFDQMMETMQNSPHHCYSVGKHTIETLKCVSANRYLRIVMLLHDVAKPLCVSTKNGRDHFYGHPKKGAEMSKMILRRLKFDNDTIKKVAHLILFHDERPELTEKNVRKMVSRVGVDYCPMLIEIKRADLYGQSEYKRTQKEAYVNLFEKMYKEILEKKQCVQKADLAVNGKDLMEIGVPQGKQVGVILESLFQEVLENPERNEKDILLGIAKTMI